MGMDNRTLEQAIDEKTRVALLKLAQQLKASK
jgi:hypothetical protein